MTHEFEVRADIELAATPEQVWEAIATGPGVDSWFMGHTEIEPGQGGATRFTQFGQTQPGQVTAWEPAKHFSFRSEDPEGTFMAFDYLIEGREGGSTVLRFVHSGILGDDWEEQYDALNEGDRMYLQKLAAYVKRFSGRTSRFSLLLPSSPVTDLAKVEQAFRAAFSLTGPVTEGTPARLAVADLPADEGTVEFVNIPRSLGVCTADGLYTLAYGYGNMAFVSYHDFSDTADQKATEQAWQNWLSTTFA